MWTALTRLPSMLLELIALTREQNALLRELIHHQTGRSAQTPLVVPGTPHRLPPPSRPASSSRRRTAADVTIARRLPHDDQQRENRQSDAVAPARAAEAAAAADVAAVNEGLPPSPIPPLA